jgi:membrane protein required for colicin V production
MEFFERYNLIDLFIIGTLLITLTLGIWKGFIRSLTGLASLVFGVVLAMKYYSVVEPYLGKISSLDPHISMILSMVIVFIAVQVVFVVIRRVLDALLDLTRLSWLDRIFGAAMGLVAGFLVVAATVEVMLLGIPEWPLVKESRLARPVDQLAREALQYVPKSARDQVQALISKWKGTRESVPSQSPRQVIAPKGPPIVPPQTSPTMPREDPK